MENRNKALQEEEIVVSASSMVFHFICTHTELTMAYDVSEVYLYLKILLQRSPSTQG